MMDKLLFKIKNCPNFSTLYAMEDRFNEVGLTLQLTTKDRIVLCKIVNNKPCYNEPIEDYIFLGRISDKEQELSDRMISCITNFVINAAGEPSEIVDEQRVWQDGVRLYGQILVVNEDIKAIAQEVINE